MTRGESSIVGVRLVLGVALILALPGGAQSKGQSGAQSGTQVQRMPGGSLGQQVGPMIGDSTDNDPVEQQKRLKALNAERQKTLVADTNKLVKLAGQLNTELAGAHPEALNPDQLRKVAEIEKLAHNIKEKMSMSVKGIPVFESQPMSPR